MAEEGTLFVCGICKEKFDTKFLLKMHINNVHKEKNCEFCDGKLFQTKNSLKRHISEFHRGVKTDHRCRSCEKSFSRAAYLKLHVSSNICASNSDSHKHKCDFCDKSFASAPYLKHGVNGWLLVHLAVSY